MIPEKRPQSQPSRPRAATQTPSSSKQIGSRTGAGFPLAWWLIPLAFLQFTWLGWYLYALLPNARNLGVFARRGVFLLNAFPGVIPDVTWSESLLGATFAKLGHLEYLPQRLPVILSAFLIAVAAISLGDLTLRLIGLRAPLKPGERIALGFGLGCTLLGVVTLGIGRFGLLNPWLFRFLLAGIVLGNLVVAKPWRTWGIWLPAFIPRASWLPALLFVPFLWLMFLGSMLPSIDFDVIEYHLQGPKEYYQGGQIRFLPHNVYTSMPFGVEMLHLLGMEILDDWWWGALVGQLLIMLFAPAAAVLIAAAAHRGGSPRAAWIAAVVYLSTPWIYRLAIIAYVEGPLCFYHAALIWLVVMGRSRNPVSPKNPDDDAEALPATDNSMGISVDESSFQLLLGLLSGGAMACKYPGLISAVIPFGILSFITSVERRSVRPILLFGLGWGIVMAPWLGKNVLDTGNPVYPLEYRIFGGRYWNAELDQKFRNGHAPRPVTLPLFVDGVLEVTGGSDWQSGLYVALAPLAFLRRGSRRLATWLAIYVIYLFLTWWFLTHRIDRFWLPLLAPLAVLAGLGGDWIRNRAWTAWLAILLGFHLVTNFAYVTTSHAGYNEWTADLLALRKDLPRRMDPPLATVDQQLPPDAKLLVVGQAAVFPFSHSLIYNTVFNEDTLETLSKGRSPEEFREVLRGLGITHIYLDWQEIRRYRQPGNYGFTDYTTPERLNGWVEAGVLDRPRILDPSHELYRVR